tara:strand:+ start:357 stop:530 length:174 start_codon:yes stop_codon:yes gene_type:complete
MMCGSCMLTPMVGGNKKPCKQCGGKFIKKEDKSKKGGNKITTNTKKINKINKNIKKT